MATIIGVGLNKTGTTTFGDACEVLGLSRLGWNTSEQFRSHELLKLWDEGDLDKLVDVANRFDALEGFPWSLIYPELAQIYPDAKFVLTRRATPEKWLASAIKHDSGSRGYGMHLKIFGSLHPTGEPDDPWLAKYRSHLADVREFFAGTERMVEVCWEEGDGWPQLCGLLGIAIPDSPFPHSNPAGSNRRRSRKQRPWAVRKASKLQRKLSSTLRST